MEEFAAYSHAIASMAGFALIALILNPMAGALKAKDGVVSGAAPDPDYNNRTYRIWRAHLNATEMMGVFVAVTVSAIMVGASPFWVNLLAALFFVSRIAHVYVHVQGIGAMAMGPRTFIFVFGWAMCLLLGLMALLGAIF